MLRSQALRLRFNELVRNGDKSGLVEEYNVARTTAESHPSYRSRITPNTPQVQLRNRYRDVVTLDDTRVKLSGSSDGGDYINANLVKVGSAQSIVCQAPLEHTAEHFWQMCWEQSVPIIVMLTGFREPHGGGCGMREKCFRYFGDEKQLEQKYGAYTVEVASQHEMAPGWTRRLIRVSYGATIREVAHVHCTSWPDFGALQPGDVLGLQLALDMVQQSRKTTDEAAPPPVVVHCSAGIGRSGTFVALDALLELARAGQWEQVDPLKVVPQLRDQRPGMVQTAEQYGMIYQVLLALVDEEED